MIKSRDLGIIDTNFCSLECAEDIKIMPGFVSELNVNIQAGVYSD